MSGKVIPVRVALRARPLILKEENEGCQTCLWFNSNEPQVVIGKDKAFTFDYVFSPKDNQQDVYEKAVRKLVKNTFKGYHATVLAYGQTGSGKTYSMGGCYEASLSQDEEMMGIIPRILKDLFKGIQERPDCDFKVRVSYLEIYNEDLLDLLCTPAQRQPLSIREEINGEIKIKGLREMNVSTLDETLQCLAHGARYRTTGATAMNDTSSRSHAIFTVHVDCSKKDDVNDSWQAKFHLVDLAGSERAKKTRAEGDRFKEGVNINKGLLALGNVISALGEDTAKRGHIPYRDSKLTRLLQDSLGGNSHTLMVACVSPADSNMEETLNTLRYADRARKIKNKPVINRDPQSDEIIRLREIVQSLQLQLLQRGGACSNVNSESSLLSSISTESREELTKLAERAKQLEEENIELTRELQSAVDQNTRMFGSIIQLEASRDRLKNKLRSFKQDTGVDFELLSSSLDVESNPQMKAELEKLRKLTEQVKDNNADSDEDADIVEEDEEVHIAERDTEQDAAPDTPDSRAMNTRHALRQAQMSRELQELNRILSRKQELASQMDRSEEEMATMRAHYEKLMQEWEGKVSQLEKEKEELSMTLFDARTNANATKVSEQRRKRLQELEQEMAQLKRKMADQAKILKLKDSSEKHVSRLNVEIQSLKQQRVKLMKQMKEENDVWRRWKQQKDKEVLQLMQKDRKRQAELAKLQQTNEKQQSVLKRKVEEAAAANRRLKEALSRQKAVLAERSTKMDTCDATSIGNRVRKWLSHELDVRVSLREARYHMEALMADRKELSQQMRHLKERIGEASPSKKYLWMDDSGSRGEKSFEEEEIRKQIEVLATEIELRNVQIQDLQQKICDADQESKGKSVWEGLHTMMEAKCALKWLLDQAVDAKAERTTLQGELKDIHQMSESNKEVEQELLTKIKRLQKVHEEELMQLRKEHEQKTLLLLGVNPKKTTNNANDKTLKAKLDIMEAELAKMSSLSDELEKKKEECEELKRHMTGLMYDGKLALMPSIDDPHASPFLTPRPKLQAKHKNAPGKVFQPETPSGFTDLESEEDDERNDPSWKVSSAVARNLPKRSFSSSSPVDVKETVKQNGVLAPRTIVTVTVAVPVTPVVVSTKS
ncbi:chromosome-associated kinesin KIF4-like [Pomacea canaliculata]|uniref:chromosome-associated kinesin KIF4-like n=1 Tax=Pomacea canaliculata TaxID=400727 RepID=UPI000D73EAA4|nr:chromosome-associated kinesin KIF4-like [Pomacea canaliculata]